MALSTGIATPTGTIVTGEGIYMEGGPEIYFQDAAAAEANNPDSDGFYWGLSGTATFPITQLECYDDFQMTDDVTENMITCQNLGEVAAIERRNHIQLTLTLKSLLPFSILSQVMRGGPVTQNVGEETEKFGLGEVSQQYYHVFISRIYDQLTGDVFTGTFHRAKFGGNNVLSTPYADAWNIPIQLTAFADNTKPRAQRFGTLVRLDPDQIP